MRTGNSGGGKFPMQISHRKDQHGSPGIEEKTSQPFLGLSINTILDPQILVTIQKKYSHDQVRSEQFELGVRSLFWFPTWPLQRAQ